MRLPTTPALRGRSLHARRDPRAARRAAGLLALVLTACGGGEQPAVDFHRSLTEKGACGDVYFYAHDRDETLLLEFVTAEPQLEGEGTKTVSWTLPIDTIEITVKSGEALGALACGGNGAADVAHTWTAVEGEADLTLVQDAALNWAGTLALRGVHLETDTLQPLDIPGFTIADEPIGP